MQLAELVRRALVDEAEAWELIVKGNTKYILAVASRNGFGYVAEDIKQVVFLLASQRLATLRDPLKLRNWLTGIALNVINGYREQLWRERRLFEQGEQDLNRLVDPCPRVDRQMIESEQKRTLMAAVRSLPVRQRQVVTLRHCFDYDLEQIATELGIEVNAVKCSLYQGLKTLRRTVSE
jgi:RNA polymerase sigma factor (sigma-70 family)